MADNVNKPSHYMTGKIETIDHIQDMLGDFEFDGFCIGNVIKYISRFRHKNGLEDLKKARWYLDRVIAKMEGAGNCEQR